MTQAVARRDLASTMTSAGNRGTNVADMDWRDMLELATELATVDGFVPKALLNHPPAILATLLAGAELGLGPMAALRAIYIIDGKATLAAVAARALVYAAGHEMKWDGSDTKCVARGRRRGEADWTEIEWTMDRARRAKLADRQAWRMYPRAMLTARATSELANLKFSDVLMGLDIMETTTEDAVADVLPPSKRNVRRRIPADTPQATERPLETALPSSAQGDPLPSPAEPPLPGEGVLEEGETPALHGDPPEPESTITTFELRRLHARMAETFPEADRPTLDRLRHALVIMTTRDRPDGSVASSKELTTEELMGFESRLNYIRTGECLVGDMPDGRVSFNMRGREYVVNTETREVATNDAL